jgi:uncharacterized protein YjbJ (UPF0337 family)
MDWDRISGNWAHWKARVRERWSKLTEEHLSVIAGRREPLVARLQELYGLSRDEAERQLRNWERTVGVEEFDIEDIVDDDEESDPPANGRKQG